MPRLVVNALIIVKDPAVLDSVPLLVVENNLRCLPNVSSAPNVASAKPIT